MEKFLKAKCFTTLVGSIELKEPSFEPECSLRFVLENFVVLELSSLYSDPFALGLLEPNRLPHPGFSLLLTIDRLVMQRLRFFLICYLSFQRQT